MPDLTPDDYERSSVRPELDPDPVRAFLGCLMACRPDRGAFSARELLAGMRPSDAGPGIRGVVFELILAAVAAGLAPDPRVLLAEARRRGLLDTEDKTKQFTWWVFDTYQTAPYPETGPFLRTVFLEAAFRRSLREHAQRLLAAVEHASIEQLRVLAGLDDDLVDLWQRYDAATSGLLGPVDADRHEIDTTAQTHRRAA